MQDLKQILDKMQITTRRRTCIALALIWFGLIYLLPREAGNVVAALGLLAYFLWMSNLNYEQPKWGCFVNMKQAQIQIKIDERLAKMDDRRSLLRPTEASGKPDEELLRAAGGGATAIDSKELLRGGENPV